MNFCLRFFIFLWDETWHWKQPIRARQHSIDSVILQKKGPHSSLRRERGKEGGGEVCVLVGVDDV